MKKLFFLLLIVHCTLNIDNCMSQWYQLNSGTSIYLNKIHFVNSQTGWAGGFQSIPTQYILIKTTNGGLNWFSQINNFPTGNRIESLYFIDANTGYIAGGDGLFKTTNGGNNYTSLPPVTIACIDCFFINALTGWVSVATGNSEIYKTTNGGTNWTSQLYSSYSSPRYSFIRFVNSSTGWCVNDSIFKTTNGGLNWSRQALPVIPFHQFFSVFAISSETAWITGTSRIVLSTTNGGTNWLIKNLGDYAVLSSYFLNSSTGYITTSNSEIYKTTNNGTNWILQLRDTSTTLNSIYFSSNDTGYACGSKGKIYKTVNGGGSVGIRKINSEIPSSFYLYQNYPNPFNPNTTIKYSIPENGKWKIENGNVLLKVYDILGKEVETLVNETQKPGVYEVTFDGSKYVSGIYFYKLTAGSFSEVKRMILIK